MRRKPSADHPGTPWAEEATEEQVEGCEFLRTVYGGRALGATVFSGSESARVSMGKMMEQATAYGATHVVVTSLEITATGGASASGKAYRCPEQEV